MESHRDLSNASGAELLDYFHCTSPECKLCRTLDEYRKKLAQEQGETYKGRQIIPTNEHDEDDESGTESDSDEEELPHSADCCCVCDFAKGVGGAAKKAVEVIIVQPKPINKRKPKKKKKRKKKAKKLNFDKIAKRRMTQKEKALKDKCCCCCCRPRRRPHAAKYSAAHKLNRDEKPRLRKPPAHKTLKQLDRIEVRRMRMWNHSALCWEIGKGEDRGNGFQIPLLSPLLRSLGSALNLTVCGSLAFVGIIHDMPPDLFLIDKVWSEEEESRMHDPSQAEDELVRRRAQRIVGIENRSKVQRILGLDGCSIDLYQGSRLIYKLRKQHFSFVADKEVDAKDVAGKKEKVVATNFMDWLTSTHTDLLLLTPKDGEDVVLARLPLRSRTVPLQAQLTRELRRAWDGAAGCACCTRGEELLLVDGYENTCGFPHADLGRERQLLLMRPHPCLCELSCGKSFCREILPQSRGCCVTACCQPRKELRPAMSNYGRGPFVDGLDVVEQGCVPYAAASCVPCCRVACDFFSPISCHLLAHDFKRGPGLSHAEAAALKKSHATKISVGSSVQVDFPETFTELQRIGTIAALLGQVA